jgi:hypothetical protein
MPMNDSTYLVPVFIGAGVLILSLIGALMYFAGREQKRHTAWAADAIARGLPTKEVLRLLVEGGLDTVTAEVAVLGAVRAGHISKAREALAGGKSQDEVRADLIAAGLNEAAADAVLQDAVEANRPPPTAAVKAGRATGGFVLILVGTAVFLAGFALRKGHQEGTFRTFPMAGTLVAALGVALVFGGAVLAGRRAAIAGGILMVAAGLGLFGFGLAHEDGFASLFPLAGVFVTVAGGGAIAAGTDVFGPLGRQAR